VQRYEPRRVFEVKRVQVFLVDETYVRAGSFEAWVWVAVSLYTGTSSAPTSRGIGT